MGFHSKERTKEKIYIAEEGAGIQSFAEEAGIYTTRNRR